MKGKTFPEAIWAEDPKAFSNANACVQGHAEFDATRGVDVVIPLGSLLNPTDGSGVFREEQLSSGCIYAFTQDGYYLTVPDVTVCNGKVSYPGFASQTLHGAEVFVSRKLVRARPRIRSLSFGMTGLREWVGINPVNESSFRDERDRLSAMTYEFTLESAPRIVLYDTGGVKATVEFRWKSLGGRIPKFEHSYVADYNVVLAFENPVELHCALDEWVFPLRGFLSFCMGFYGSITSACFTTDDGAKADYYLPLVEGKDPGDTEFMRIPFSWRANSERIPSMLEAWLSFEGYEKEAATRVVSLTADWALPIELSFLATSQAFEAMSRVGRKPYEQDEEAYSQRINTIVGSIGDKKLGDWLRQKMQFANQRSANSLARELLGDLGAFAKYVVPNQKTYLRDHRDSRNYCTHLSAKHKRHVLHGSELVANTDATYMLLYGSICMRMGVSADELVEILRKTRFGADQLYRCHEVYGREV